MGFDSRVLVEVKLSTNRRLAHGYETQLEVYRAAEATTRAIYLVIDVGRMGRKHEQLIRARNAARAGGAALSDLEFINGVIRPPASRR